MRALINPLLLASTLALLGCGGGGGGGGAPQADIGLLSVVFRGSTPSDTNPDPGELLFLFFSADVELAPSASSNGIALSAGGLGSPTSVSLVDARTIAITLGTGVSFVPGTATASLVDGQSLVNGVGGRTIATGNALTIASSDSNRPVVSRFTINETPTELNGNGNAGGTLQVPPNGFSIDANYSDASSSISTGAIVLTCSQSVNVSGRDIGAGGNLLASLGSASATSFGLLVPGSVRFNEGEQTLTLIVPDAQGEYSAPVTFRFRVKNLDDQTRPLENGQVWFLDTSRDLEAISSAAGSGSNVNLTRTDGANSLADYDEVLRVIGLHFATPIANVLNSKNSNEVVSDLLQARIVSQLTTLYGGAAVSFTFASPGSFPSNKAFVDYNAASHSRIAIGGSPSPAATGALGVALFDPNNKKQEDNTLPAGTYDGVQLTVRLGVFPYTLVSAQINVSGTRFRQVFDPFVLHRGQPVGSVTAPTSDATRLVNINNNVAGDTRQTAISRALDEWARFIAIVTAHECGHSLGLVKDGAMPAGLYGGLAANFPGSTSGHISLSSTSIFPSGATTIMAPSLSFSNANHASSAFNALNLSYLRERSLYDQ